jgi:hypothetical protein
VVAQFLQDSEAAARALGDADPHRRHYALYVLVKHWKLGPNYREECARLAGADPDEEVRQNAILALADSYRETNESRIGRLFARLVCSEQEPRNVRHCAYLGLLILRWGTVRPFVPEERFLQEADWAFVHSFLAE